MENILFLYKEMLGGGAEKVIFDMAKKFNENNDYNIILAAENSCDLSLYRESNLRLYDIKFSKLKLFYSNLKKINKICKENDIKIIHSHHRLTTIYAIIISKFLRIKVVHTEHNVFPDKNWINLRGKNIIAVSENVKEALIKNGINDKYIKVIYNGINLNNNRVYKDLRNEYGIGKQTVCFGVIARLAEQKGIFYLLKAFKNIVNNNKDVVLFLMGDGELKEKIREYIVSNNLDNNVIMTGNRNDIMNIVKSIDCYILPSVYEGFPITNLEIMSNERIVIATKVGGNAEIIENGVNGYLVEPKSISELEQKIIHVLENTEKLQEMNKNARKTIENKFDINEIYVQYLNYYKNLNDR